GFHPHPPARAHVYLAKFLGATMWFFVFYRARRADGLQGWKHPWEGHGDHAHGHGHGEGEHGGH
ncbi:hypothetical protein DACRYDRAFT_48659, partial [Dacryopinax primogenitus]